MDFGLGVRVLGHNGQQIVFGGDGSGRKVGFKRVIGKVSAGDSVVDFVEAFELADHQFAVDTFN
jgi:pyruvate/2-oxoacid:ferredoxin oxidoreductase beta subunit